MHDSLEWLVERSPEGMERELARALLASLEALIERNQPAAPAKPPQTQVPQGQPA